MNNELFERLLYEGESTTLDFKREQYRFAKATDDEKSELLKDILGFVNAWRRSVAYILIGVEDVRGGRSNVVGIPATEHLNDHAIQQFVNNLTSQPVHFHYEAFGFEGKQVGIITVEEQIRPIYLKRDYGKLTKEKVYVRRGSSTDPTKPASPDEIAQMRVGSRQLTAELTVEFADIERDDPLGTNISWDAEYCEMPMSEMIPDLTRPRSQYLLSTDLMSSPNIDFFRELANFEFMFRLFQPIRLVVENTGQVSANNVRVELTIPTNKSAMVLLDSDIPDRPKRYIKFSIDFEQIKVDATVRHRLGEVIIDKNSGRFRVDIDCGNLQPGRRVWSDIFYIGIGTSIDISLDGLVFADNLPQPKSFVLNVSATVKKTSMNVDELCSLPEQPVEK